MTTTQIAKPRQGFRPAIVTVLLTATFMVGIGAGLGLSQVMARATAATRPSTVLSLPRVRNDMSSAAYAAMHQGTVLSLPLVRNDMSSAAYAAMHPRP